MTPSEKYLDELCRKSFLPFWSFPNPIGKKGKELCDILVICDNVVIIISVKDISLSEHDDPNVQYDRWVKKAIINSTEQIYGAERYLKRVDTIFSKDKKQTINLPNSDFREIHRIAIAFGSNNTGPLPHGDFGKGYVHVFDELSTYTIFNELDTISDFTEYLRSKEKFLIDKDIIIPTENDFLAFYLQTGLKIDKPIDALISTEGLWDSYIKSDDYLNWRNDIGQSYIWDKMITDLYNHHITDKTSDTSRNEIEEAIRTINLEPRLNRIELGKLLNNAIREKVKARMLKALPNMKHSYVLMPLSDKNWSDKEFELQSRCIVARLENPDTERVIGIAIGGNTKGESVFDIVSLHVPIMDNEFINHANEIKEHLGYFKKPRVSNNNDI